MSSIHQAAEDVTTLAERFRPLIELGEFLRNLSSLESAAEGAQKRKVEAEGDLALLNAQIAAATVTVAAKTREANAIADGAAKEAARVVNAATAEAESKIAEATARVAAMDDEIVEARNAIATELDAKRKELGKLDDAMVLAQAELERLNTAIAAVRARFITAD